jgi:enediyne biosynthesis protein E4
MIRRNTARTCRELSAFCFHPSASINAGWRRALPFVQARLVILAVVSVWVLSASADPLSWENLKGVRRARLPVPTEGKTGFEKLDAAKLGVLFTNHVSKTRSILNRNLLNGSGVAAGDIDGDGLCDIYFCGIDVGNALYRNLGNWKFEDITASAGVACSQQDSTGAVFADVDGDGDLDLLVSGLGHGVRLFLNDGKGHFREATDEAGLRSTAATMSMAVADVNGDGFLDLYAANYRSDTIADRPTTTFRLQQVNGRPVVAQVNGQPVTSAEWTNRFIVGPTGNVDELGEPDVLYLNDGKGRFTPVSFTGGAFLDSEGKPLTEPPRDWGLTVQMRDLNGDGAPDIYVCNDYFTPDRIWINDGHGRFRAAAQTAFRTTSIFSMGLDCADIDRDGNVDIFVADMLSPDHRKRHVQLGGRMGFPRAIGFWQDRPQVSRNTLQRSRGDGSFAEIGYYAGVEASDWSWCPTFLDVDLDGYEDILISNGVLRDFQNIDLSNRIEREMAGKRLTQSDVMQFMSNFPTLESPNIAFRNNGDWTFEEKGAAWGFDTRGVSQSMAVADFDNDGDLDLVVNNLEAGAGLYRNQTVAPRLAIRLKGSGGNTQGIGAKIVVRGGPVEQSTEMICGGHYLSGSQALRVFAAGRTNQSLSVEVDWRDGRQTVFPAEANFIYEVSEQDARPRPPVKKKTPAPWFEEVTTLGPAYHVDEPFDELARQPLLVRYLSQLGPGVCWHDVDGDGWDDLIMGSGRGGRLLVLQNHQGASFSPMKSPALSRVVARDQTTVLGMAHTLLVGSSNYEDGSTNGGLIRIYDLQRNVAGETLLGHSFSCGPLAFADIDGDGDLDLFVGGRAVPGRYPEPADSLLFRNERGRFVLAQRWEKLGLVSGAVFSDLDQDGTPELVLAMDWGPIRVFKLVNGVYQDWTQKWGLDQYTGWWNGVATGDFDGSGHLSIVASNWGLNSAYRTSRAYPRKLYYGDLDGNGTLDLIDARFDPEMGKEVPERTFNIILNAMPYLQDRVPSYEAYANMSVREVYGDSLARTGVLQANTFQTMVFSFHNGKYEGKPLPPEAQLSPAFGVCVGDMDGDGFEDLFLSQNFFALAPTEARCDAGRGLWLRGNGHGGFSPVPGQESGVEVYGEQRGCALSDYDGDGRVDLAVSQNGNALRLFHNIGAKPGLRVRVQGPPANPTGIGALLRLEADGVKGAVREVQAGSGYWSQNSSTQVMALPEGRTPTTLWVQRPGGQNFSVPIPKGAKEVEVGLDGTIRMVR